MGFCNNCNQEVSSKFCPNCGKEATETIKSTKGDTTALIDELYALRSGLSRISQENDKVKKLNGELSRTKYNNDTALKRKEYELQSCLGNLSQCNSQRAYLEQNVMNENNSKIAEKNKYDGYVASDSKDAKIWGIWLAISLTCAIVFLILIIVGASYPSTEEIHGILIPAGAYGLLASVIWSIVNFKKLIPLLGDIRLFKKRSLELNKQIRSHEEIKRYLENNSKQSIDLNSRKTELEKQQKKLQAERNELKDFDYSPLENALSQQKNASVEFYKEFYPSYLARFEKVLDPRDWRNLDLVIFILETGRADNLRDALIQVDGYRHTEAIVNAVSSASQAICRTISNEADRLQRAIATHVDTINSNLVAIAEGQKSLNSSLGVLNSSITKQINATELQNALIEKANTSSDKLAKDVEEIRNYFIR